MAKSKKDIILENLESIEIWAKQGMSEKQIAMNLKISYSYFREQKKSLSALSEALCRGKIVADVAVENALYKRALGYDAVETVAVKVKSIYFDERDNKCQKEEVVTVDTIRHIPADPGAQKFWLINRQKDSWKDNPHKVINDKELLEIKKKLVEKDVW